MNVPQFLTYLIIFIHSFVGIPQTLPPLIPDPTYSRRWALNLVKLHPAKTSQNQKFNRACWSDDFREEIIFGACQKV